jgi:acyl-coenzyme A synthetase/AMP-(fatty) acid ligase
VIDADGFLTVQGRVNDQISVDGMKCQPLEVENVLNLHPAVRESAVVGLPDEDTYQCVGAAVAAAPGHDERQLVESLRALCRQKLEPVKVPKRIVFVGSIPRTDLGKIKRTEILKLMTEAREA